MELYEARTPQPPLLFLQLICFYSGPETPNPPPLFVQQARDGDDARPPLFIRKM